ncbi:hypothetical protein ACJ2A9_06050 [Anaerobacillus sp. MEB173]|uniref:hypothetical protein n=1 Tax=Anaerobacillus sp. MEB173 TaxID=3383345 RepID=UPI003F92DF7D
MVEYDVHQVVNILRKYYITDSVQMVTRWIRQGKMRGERSENRKEGYRIYHDDLFEFIEEERPGLPSIMAVYEEYQEKEVPKEISMKINEHKGEMIKETKSGDIDHQVEGEVLPINVGEEDNYELLNEMVNYLQNQVQEKETEIQYLQEALFDVQKEASKWEEEYKEMYQLCEEYEREAQSLKNKLKMKTKEEKNRIEDDENFQLPKSYDETKNNLMNMIKKMSINQEMQTELKNKVLSTLFDENHTWRKEIYLEDGTYKCPIEKKRYKYVGKVITNVVNSIYESLNTQEKSINIQ